MCQWGFGNKFEFVPSPFAVIIELKFKCIAPKLWPLVVFCDCWSLLKGLDFYHEFSHTEKRPTAFAGIFQLVWKETYACEKRPKHIIQTNINTSNLLSGDQPGIGVWGLKRVVPEVESSVSNDNTSKIRLNASKFAREDSQLELWKWLTWLFSLFLFLGLFCLLTKTATMEGSARVCARIGHSLRLKAHLQCTEDWNWCSNEGAPAMDRVLELV